MSKMNPLAKYTKIENLFVKLPSNGVAKYPVGILKNNKVECGVCARSSRDELMLNNPDALMNGQAVVNVIENCVPNIEDANGLYVGDVELLLVAIKLATKESVYQIEVDCPKCEKHGAFDRDLEYLLNTAEMLEELPDLILEDVGGLILSFVPHTWQDHSDFGLRMFQYQKQTQVLETLEATDEEKMKIFSGIVEEMTQLNFDMVVANIASIEVPDLDEPVTDREFIAEWLGQQPSFVLQQIKDKIKELDGYGINHTMDVQCSDCEHEWTIENIIFDPSHFFGLA